MSYCVDRPRAQGAVELSSPALWIPAVLLAGVGLLFLMPKSKMKGSKRKTWLTHNTRARRSCEAPPKPKVHKQITC